MKTLLLILTLVATPAMADTVAKYGVNVSKDKENMGSVKSIFIADQQRIAGPIIRQYEIGGWVDNTGIEGRKSSLMLGPSIGVDVSNDTLFAQALVGPSMITNHDSALGGPLQFNNDIAFGVRDPQTKATVGLDYKHVSSGGLELPNRGRDFLMFRVSLPW